MKALSYSALALPDAGLIRNYPRLWMASALEHADHPQATGLVIHEQFCLEAAIIHGGLSMCSP